MFYMQWEMRKPKPWGYICEVVSVRLFLGLPSRPVLTRARDVCLDGCKVFSQMPVISSTCAPGQCCRQTDQS